MAASFEWDPRKAAQNYVKHEVSFGEASTVFGDPLERIRIISARPVTRAERKAYEETPR